MPTISRCGETTAVAGGVGRAKPGRVPTEWPNLVGTGYFTAHQIICAERPDVYIEEYLPGETVAPGVPVDEHRVRVFMDANFVVILPFPIVG
ncbi:hypothetical protein HU200_054847 [Digitaria exilis]|uniref:Uncharacterized protein n=1 Tax=Digitaria exilis TaxID=1010633 RepID=A0A835E295_9POAL|nr:hypothetical protein HU200_054847 [Digitaria exilis]